MLKATFQCFRGIGPTAEQKLWQRGCLCWRDFRNGGADFLSPRKRELVGEQLAAAESALAAGLADWFLNRLSGPAKLRLLHDFADRALFLDIETTGLEPFYDEVTTVATWRNGIGQCFVRGFNLELLLPELATAELLVTFNGSRFDLPFLRQEFGIDLMQPHLDLMYPMRSLGYRGGLKVCERQLGFRRTHSEGADGMEAVRLWYAWRRRRNTDALRRLIAYNLEDTYCLAWLAARLSGHAMSDYPLTCRRPPPPPPEITGILENLAL